MRAMSALMRDAGMSTRVCFAVTALRIRVSMSAIGSVISEPLNLVIDQLPTALRHSRNVSLKRELAEAESAQRELAHVGARPAAQAAAVAQPNLVLRRLQFLGHLRCSCHVLVFSFSGGPCPPRLTLSERHPDELED